MFEFAQTNLQLLDQARGRGIEPDGIRRISTAYGGSIPLFSGMYRANGKPILSHLVGTGSVLLSVDAELDVVLAGLLHAAYTLGDFGAGVGNAGAKADQDSLRRLIGEPAEGIVHAYTNRPWNVRSIGTLVGDVPTLSELERAVVVVRIANEVDDHLNGGVLYCADGPSRRAFIEASKEPLLQIAASLGEHALAGHLERSVAACLAFSVPPELRSVNARSYRQLPTSVERLERP